MTCPQLQRVCGGRAKFVRHIPYTSPHIPHSCVANAICLSPLFQLISWYNICLSRYLAPGSIMGSDLVGGGDGGCMPDESISAVSLRHVIFNPVAFKNAPVVVCGTVVLLDKDRMDLSQDGAKLIVELSQLDEAVLRSLKLSAKVLVRGRVHKQQRRTYMVAERVALPQKSRSPDPASEAAPKGDAELWHEASSALFSCDARGHLAEDDRPSAISPQRKDPRRLRARELSVATAGFDTTCLIASGADGQVFKAVLPSLRTSGPCAVKRLQGGRAEGVRAEADLLSKCVCPNLLPLLGYCLEDPLCLIFPLMSGGTLEDRVLLTAHGKQRLNALGHASAPPPLTWWERIRILRDAMRGLVYLHTACQTIHCDVKPNNILLDERLHARLADFGSVAHVDSLTDRTGQLLLGASANRHDSTAASSRTGEGAWPPASTADELPVYDDLVHGLRVPLPMQDVAAPPPNSPRTPLSTADELPVYDDLVHGIQLPLPIQTAAAPPTTLAAAPATPPRSGSPTASHPTVGALADSSERRAPPVPPRPPASEEMEMKGVDVRLHHRLYDDLPSPTASRSKPSEAPRARHRVSPQPLRSTTAGSVLLPVLPSADDGLAAGAPCSPEAACRPADMTNDVVAPQLRQVDSFNWVLEAEGLSSAAAAAPLSLPPKPPLDASSPKQFGRACDSPQTEMGRKAVARTDAPAGFVAGLCPTRPGQYGPPAKFVPGLRGTRDFIDPLYAQPGTVHSGKASAMTDGYARVQVPTYLSGARAGKV